MTHKLLEWDYDNRRVQTVAVQAWTDYPFVYLGDEEYKEAPIRKCWVVAYEGAGYPYIMVEHSDGTLQQQRVKLCYVYRKPGRCGEVRIVDRWKLRDHRNRPAWQFMRRRYTKKTYRFYHDGDPTNERMAKFDTRADLIRTVDNKGWQGEAWYWDENHHSGGCSSSEHERFGDTYPDPPTFCFPIKRRRKGRK